MATENNYQNEDLLSLLKIIDANSTQDKINKVFNAIANKLFRNYHIVKGENTYDFLEIEFYLYSPNHQDLITYPRKSNKPGMWFFHMSGVDITFGSNPEENDNQLMYGGILVRSIIKTSGDKSTLQESTICGPMKCVDELFDYIYAFDGNISRADIPYIDKKNEDKTISVKSCCRYIPLLFSNKEEISKKIHSKFEELKKRRTEKDWKEFPKLKEDWEKNQYSEKKFEEFLKKPYRYYRNDYNNYKWMKGYNANPEKDQMKK